MRNNSSPALACQNVEKSFNIQRQTNALSLLFGRPYCGPTVQALRNINLSVNSGEIVGVIGRNGAGKSTLLRVLAGVYSPTAGKISVDGQVQGLFEMGGMGNRFLTGREYAERFLQLMGISKRKLTPILQDIHDFTELEDAFERPIHTYSTGMQARLYFAVGTSVKTDIYLVDELLSVGDEHFQAKCWLRIRQMLAGGASGVLVTHDWAAILKLCRSTVVLSEGTIDFFGSSDQAVVKYLNIPLPDGDAACFLNETPAIQEAKATGTTSIRAWVRIKKDLPVEIAMSIEILRIGVGWEIVTITKPSQISRTPGRYCVTYIIDNTPFVPGEYSLNLFLSYRDSNNEKVACDVRSWTYGNGLALVVEGDSKEAVANLPFEVSGDIAE